MIFSNFHRNEGQGAKQNRESHLVQVHDKGNESRRSEYKEWNGTGRQKAALDTISGRRAYIETVSKTRDQSWMTNGR